MDTNRTVGWGCIAAGIGVGLVIGLWSFDGPMPVPSGIGAYGDTARRLLRLGHIAFVALGILNVLLAREIETLRLGAVGRRLASRLLSFGAVALPITLLVAVWIPPAKYVMSVPASCVFLALVLAAWGSRGQGGNRVSNLH